MLPLNFNSHAHVERDTFCKRFNKWAIEFQLTRSRGAWHTTGAGTAIVFNFNSHAHVERDKSTIFMSLSGVNFNSHAHVERDNQCVKNQPYGWISTHTLTWSVTEELLKCHGKQVISTHTLTWSVTIENIHKLYSRMDFNSHAHVERDWLLPPPATFSTISTHTLTWSVTHDPA